VVAGERIGFSGEAGCEVNQSKELQGEWIETDQGACSVFARPVLKLILGRACDSDRACRCSRHGGDGMMLAGFMLGSRLSG